MEFPKEDVHSLVELGLTLVQAKVFLSLIKAGPMKAQTIANVSRVSRADVYRALDMLQENGLIEKQISKPTLFHSIPTEEALDLLMERKNIRHNDLKFKKANLLNKYKEKEGVIDNQFNFVFVPSRETLIKRLNMAIARAEKSIDVSTSCKRLTAAGFSLSEKLQDAWHRGVKGRAVIDINGGIECTSIKNFWCTPEARIRYVPEIPRTVMAMYDRKEVFIFVNPTAQLKESPALWSNVPSIVAMAEDYFEGLWRTALENPNFHLEGSKD